MPFAVLVAFLSCSKSPKQSAAPTSGSPNNSGNMQNPVSFYDFTMKAIDGAEIPLSQYKGKKVLVVNTASKCGYTPQYKELEELHRTMGDKVAILGFPANDFMWQEPGTNQEIAAFCEKNYGVTFQMFEKITVKGKNKHPLFQFLSDKSLNGWNDQEPSWNFCKYLIDENGKLLKFYKSGVNPMSEEITGAIQ